ncbi:MAG: aspartate carbamoyltransferase, partial [Bacillota bacterium]|nr:aspartate carbamoyltransferase [Bacillota bacterium]
RFSDNEFYLISTSEMSVPSYIKDYLNKHGQRFTEVRTLEECIGDLDILYMTRIQKERFASEEDYKKQAGIYILDTGKLKKAKKELVVLHPLPKVDEITYEADEDPRCIYFKQAQYGMYIRMALIMTLIENDVMNKYDKEEELVTGEMRCSNPNCITAKEPYLKNLIKHSESGKTLCAFCDHEVL